MGAGRWLKGTVRWFSGTEFPFRGTRGLCCATPPSDPAQAHFVALDTASPYLLVHEASDAGKLAHYLLRWVNTRSEPGPWSETISATITG